MGPAGKEQHGKRETGSTLTSAPVSTKNCRPLERSVTKKRQLSLAGGLGCWLPSAPGLGISRPVAGRNTLVGLAAEPLMIPAEGGLVPGGCKGRTGCTGTGL